MIRFIKSLWRRKPEKPDPVHCFCGEPLQQQLSGTGRNRCFICPSHGMVAVRQRKWL